MSPTLSKWEAALDIIGRSLMIFWKIRQCKKELEINKWIN